MMNGWNMVKNGWKRLPSIVGAVLFMAVSPLYAQDALPANSIEAINVAQQGGVVTVKLSLKEPLTTPPVGFAVANPARVALDFPATGNGLGRNAQTVDAGGLRSINVVQVGERTRLVLNLNQAMTFDARPDGREVYVTLRPVDTAKNTTSLPAAPRFVEARTPAAATISIRDIAFRRGADGEGRITVDLSDANAGIDIRQQGPNLVVDFLKVALPAELSRRLDVTDFGTPVTRFETTAEGGNVRMTIAPHGLWEHTAYQTDNQFVIEVKPIVENPNKLVQGSRLGYQGPKVSISYYNGDVRQLLRVMAEELGLNAVISETVSGTTTLVLKDVPADQVLDIILQQKGLDMRKNGNVILIAPRDELATKEKLELESRQQIGDLEPVRTESFQLNYQKADAVQKLLTDSNQRILSKRGSAVVDSRTNILFVQDAPSRLEEVRRLISKIDVAVRQVLIEARIVEAQDTFSRNLGTRLGVVDLGSAGRKYQVGGNLSSVGYLSGQSSTQASLIPDSLSVNLPAAAIGGAQAGAFSFTLFNSAKTQFLNMEITALEADGKGKVVSSPRVVTADQVEALIEQGVEIPYQQATSSGATSISFRKANLALKVKPQVTPDGRVIMSLDVNKDTPNTTLSTGAGVAIDTKHVKTEVLVENGGTVVIGGIYTQESRDTASRVPLLGDLPYFGFLFRQTGKVENKTELLVFITPKIVNESLGLR
jgi:type IV pilus assembly protein PilQ